MATTNQNLLNLLNQDDKAQMIEEYILKALLSKPMREGTFNKASYGMVLGLPTMGGQYMRLTQTKGLRRPQKMLAPGGAGSDPLSPATTGINDMNVPLEWLQEYIELSKVLKETSWLDFENIMENGLSDSLALRNHELIQNAMVVGRFKPGQYDANGDVSVAFDQTVEATYTDYGLSFTFKSLPKIYAGGVATFNDLIGAANRTSYTDLARIATGLKLSGAPTINGKYVCAMSQSMMDDMLTDPELDPRIASALIASSSKARKGMEDGWMGEYGALTFIEDTWAYTEDAAEDQESKRAEWGDVHTAFIFGKEAYGSLQLGGQKMGTIPALKIQDITKTGYSKSLGYLVPGQAAVVNSNNGACYKALVSTAKPNNYSETNKQQAFGGESIG